MNVNGDVKVNVRFGDISLGITPYVRIIDTLVPPCHAHGIDNITNTPMIMIMIMIVLSLTPCPC